MVEISENIPFLWRLSSHSEEGFCAVSMVVPFNSGNESLEHTIETDVLSFTSDDYSAEEEEILEWNEDDIGLFLKLIANKESGKEKLDALAEGFSLDQTYKVDLTDPETIEIIQIVAAAGFGLALPTENLLLQSDRHTNYLNCNIEPGSQVSLSTVNGYKRCIVADINNDDVACVMLDKIVPRNTDYFDEIYPHDLILVKQHQLLDPSYTSVNPSKFDVLH